MLAGASKPAGNTVLPLPSFADKAAAIALSPSQQSQTTHSNASPAQHAPPTVTRPASGAIVHTVASSSSRLAQRGSTTLASIAADSGLLDEQTQRTLARLTFDDEESIKLPAAPSTVSSVQADAKHGTPDFERPADAGAASASIDSWLVQQRREMSELRHTITQATGGLQSVSAQPGRSELDDSSAQFPSFQQPPQGYGAAARGRSSIGVNSGSYSTAGANTHAAVGAAGLGNRSINVSER